VVWFNLIASIVINIRVIQKKHRTNIVAELPRWQIRPPLPYGDEMLMYVLETLLSWSCVTIESNHLSRLEYIK
jgi:hypothetical protein